MTEATTELTTSQILDKAADLIETRGWTTVEWNLDRPEKPLCLEGGILAAMGYTESSFAEEEYVGTIQTCPAFMAVRDYLGFDGRYLYGWNDQFVPGTSTPVHTQEEVVEVLRATAEREREAGR